MYTGSGRVNKDVRLAIETGHGFFQGGHTLGRSQVRTGSSDPEIFLGCLGKKGFGRLFSANVVCDYVRAGARKLKGNGPPDASRAAGDQSVFGLERKRIHR